MMPAAEYLARPDAEDLYKQLLRKERAAWDALLARPHDSREIRNWRRSTAAANHARAAFLEPSPSRSKGANESRPSAKGALTEAIRRQKAAWAAYEQSLNAGSADAAHLHGVWLEAMARVRSARTSVDAQAAPTRAAVQWS